MPEQGGPETSLAARFNTLWIGFSAVLLLMIFAGFDAARTIRNLETTTSRLRLESRSRDLVLDRIRTELQRSGTLARDYLLETNRDRAGQLQREMERMRLRSAQDLARYEELLPADERATFRQLKTDAQAYWWSLDPLLRWQPAEREAAMGRYLERVVLPRGDEAAELARQIAALNTRDLDQAEQRLQRVSADFRKRIVVVSVAAVLLGLLVAAFSVRRIRRLEREADARFREVSEARRELRRLADRLVVTQEEERRAISRELHDEVGQSMSAMLMDVGSVESALPAGSLERQRLSGARELAESTVRSIRDLALLLRPSMLDDGGLVAALNWQAREVSRRTGLKVRMVAGDAGEDLPESLRTCVYRVVQEALQNCVKHARAEQVVVSVSRVAGELKVTVEDNGAGFDPHREKGVGLLGMEERVKGAGGQFGIDSKPGGGTRLSIRLPLAEEKTA